MLDFLRELIKVAPRFGPDEIKTARLITEALKSSGISYTEEPFESAVPRITKADLYADGVEIPCLGSSLVSGEIKDGKYLISSFGHSGEPTPYNINYNPITDAISVVDMGMEPSVTISRTSVMPIVIAKEVHGSVEVKKEPFTTENILVGNIDEPENMVFVHYDSIIGDGAVDNGAAVALLLNVIQTNKELIKNNLFVFAGNEEMSYDDYKTKSGYGFRVFESRHEAILRKAKQIIVIDGVGVSSPTFDQGNLGWSFQVRMLEEIKDKVFWLWNDQSIALQYFHSKADTIEKIQEKYLEEAKIMLLEKLAK